MKQLANFSMIVVIPILILMGSCSEKKEPTGSMLDERLEKRIDSVLGKMTLAEKVGQMNQYSGGVDATGPTFGDRDVFGDIKRGLVGSVINVTGADAIRKVQQLAVDSSRLGIPLLFGLDVVHGYRTIFPIPVAEACSWDLARMEKAARIAAIEASSAGICWTFAPMVDIARDPRWGRVMEGAGEDPWYGSQVAVARVKGFQGESLGKENTIMATAKHFAAYGAVEGGREYNTVDISERTLRDIYLPPFKSAVEAGCFSVMNAFNEIGGIPSSGSTFLLRDILKGDWGFQGLVVSDWASIGEMIQHGVAANKKEAALLAVTAGSDVDMESLCFYSSLQQLVEGGKVDEKLVDDAVRRILRAKFKLGLFDDPYKYCKPEREKEMLLHPDHLQASLDMAKRSMVLLKNEGDILPLKKEGQKIALIGPMVGEQDDLMGLWSAKGVATDVTPLSEGVKQAMKNPSGLIVARGCDFEKDDKSGFREAIAAGARADVIVLAMGESGFMSGEVNSRARIGIPGVQQELMKELKKLGKPMVLVLFNGRPLTLEWESQNIPAILEAWLPGTCGAKAVAEVLFGDYNPSGKLVITFPRTEGQIPTYYNYKSTGRPYASGAFFSSRYMDLPNEPVYPFGYGLSYTTFQYKNLTLSDTIMEKGKPIIVSVELFNTGNRKGEEVVQLYVQDVIGSVTRPVKELKGFQKVELEAGSSQKVEFSLSESDLRFHDIHMKHTSEPGEFRVFVGGNSVDLLQARFILK